MKLKYLLIYIGVGVAFLAVSLWVVITGGKNARAINAKFKLGGIMLMAWSMISMLSCNPASAPLSPEEVEKNFGEEVMCYDPIIQNEIYLHSDKHDQNGLCCLSIGDVLTVIIQEGTYKEYTVTINKRHPEENGDGQIGELLQEATFTEEESSYEYKLNLQYEPADTDYVGPALVMVFGPKTIDGNVGEAITPRPGYNIVIAPEEGED